MGKSNKMSKRQHRREQYRKRQIRNRTWAIVAIVAGALLVSSILILPNLGKSDVENIIQITPLAEDILVNTTSLGDPNAPVKMDVWEDFQCSGCLAYTENLEPLVIQTYIKTGKVYYTFHFYPFIDGGRGESHDAANAAMCASAQERFWDYHAILFANWLGENAGSFSEPRLTAFAENLGLDMIKFEQCFRDKSYAAIIQQDIDDGDKMGVPPTPGIFVNDKMVISSAGENYIPSFEDISRAIEIELNK